MIHRTYPARRDVLASASALALFGVAGRVSAAAPITAPAEDSPRQRIRFDTGWRFAFGHLYDQDKDFGFGKDLRTFAKQGPDAGLASAADFDDSKWRAINLPHDWAVELPFVDNPAAKALKPDEHGETWDPAANHGYKPLGRDFPETSIGWYRKVVTLEPGDENKRLSLEFDGVFRSTIVIFNGYILKQHDGGYGPFRVELNDFINTDGKPNILTVRVDASLGEGWFYEGAGIYRHVWLVKTDPVHIPQYGVLVRAKTDGTVEVTTTVRNDSDQARTVKVGFTIQALTRRYDIYVPQQGVQLQLAAWQTSSVTQTYTVAMPRLWSLEAPSLYALTSLIDDGDRGLLDAVDTTFGFRDIHFDADKGFFLNGQPVKIKGACNHQDHAGVGSAVPDALLEYRLQCLKDLGCNAIRTAHNPPAPELLDAADRMGIMVIDETRMMTSSDEGLDQFSTMIRRDRNHPSVILWSIGNEEQSQQGTPRGAKIATTMKRIARELDPTRPITAAMDGGYGTGITEVIDVIGFNYRDGKIDDFHKNFPKIPIIGTETGSTVSVRGEYVHDDARHIVAAYDTEAPWWASTAEGYWPHFDAQPYIGGAFVWCGFDYRGEPTPFTTWPSISSNFGVMDTCGFPKDLYYYYRAWWRPEPLLHLLPHWNWEDSIGKPITVWAYSNCDAVELFVNGKSVGEKDMVKDLHVDWSVPYAPGKIEAYGYKNGKVILKDKRETAEAAYRVVLSADRSDLAGDGMDCAVIKAEVFDARGVAVPKADNLIRFTITGPAAVIGVGNGNPNSLEPDKASQRKAFNGLACAIVQTTGSGAITVTATADGLLAGKVVLKSV